MPLKLAPPPRARRLSGIPVFLAGVCLLVSVLLAVRVAVHADSVNTTDFVTTWRTDRQGVSCDSCITIPAQGSGYSYDVDWNNDGIFDELGLTASVTHDFGFPGEYTIRLRGSYPEAFGPMVNTDVKKLVEIKQWGNIQWRSMADAFRSASNLTISALDAPDLSNVTDMSGMFAGATALNQDISHWDTGQVTDMSYLFYGASSFNQDVSGWNTSSVTTMDSMFAYAGAFNQDISAWDTSSATTMKNMFYQASVFNQSLGTWDMAKIGDATDMLTGSALSAEKYDATLKGFAGQTLKSSVTFGASAAYCFTASNRQALIDTYHWTISDKGFDCGLRVGGYAALDVPSGIAAGGTVGMLSTSGVSLRSVDPYELACAVAGVDDGQFSIQGTTLRVATLLDSANPRDADKDNVYTLCVKMTSSDGQTAEQPLTITVIPAKVPAPSTPTDTGITLKEKLASRSSIRVATQQASGNDMWIDSSSDTTPASSAVYVNGIKLGSERQVIVSKPTFSGEVAPEAVVRVTLSPSEAMCETTAEASGAWQCTLGSSLEAGKYTVNTTTVGSDGAVTVFDAYKVEVLGAKTTATHTVANTTKPESEKKGGLGMLFAVAAVLAVGAGSYALLKRRKRPAVVRQPRVTSMAAAVSTPPKTVPPRRRTAPAKKTAPKKTARSLKSAKPKTAAKKRI